MAFQDVWNLDLERTKDAASTVVAPNGKMIPFCLYNMTSANGESCIVGSSEAQRLR